jgi:hypothetical protein
MSYDYEILFFKRRRRPSGAAFVGASIIARRTGFQYVVVVVVGYL